RRRQRPLRPRARRRADRRGDRASGRHRARSRPPRGGGRGRRRGGSGGPCGRLSAFSRAARAPQASSRAAVGAHVAGQGRPAVGVQGACWPGGAALAHGEPAAVDAALAAVAHPVLAGVAVGDAVAAGVAVGIAELARAVAAVPAVLAHGAARAADLARIAAVERRLVAVEDAVGAGGELALLRYAGSGLALPVQGAGVAAALEAVLAAAVDVGL